MSGSGSGSVARFWKQVTEPLGANYRLPNNSRDSTASFLLTPHVPRSTAARITTITTAFIVVPLPAEIPMSHFAILPVFIPKCALSVGPKIVAIWPTQANCCLCASLITEYVSLSVFSIIDFRLPHYTAKLEKFPWEKYKNSSESSYSGNGRKLEIFETTAVNSIVKSRNIHIW